MLKLKRLLKKVKEQFYHWYWEGLTGEQCWDCSGLKKKIEADQAKIKKIQREVFKQRYGTPQDYKDAQEFIDSL